ncbi:subtilisin-like protease SBT3.3 isoform X2 [Pyrus x bretschneideri]|uniref:subtilisin-like protease SBT3.3 isoform X2 n=1 Tax=Pyrus x bretschneideri TaxID=225117 RepID=UPI00202F8C98|nr:subtilisin-like protease SBT3.3 isoform X2 [Pyrus x bretschneideri]
MSNPSPLVVLVLWLLCCLNSQGMTESSNVHIVYLGETQHDNPELVVDLHHELLASVVGSKELASELMVYSYKHGFSGFAAKLRESQVQQLSGIIPNSLHKLETTRSWNFLGLSPHSPSNILPKSKMGDGVIIGVLDTGIWPESESFNEKGLGPVPFHWKGACESGENFNTTIHCNKKIIGARWFIKGLLAEYGEPLDTSTDFLSPRDANGHGTAISSIAAGSFVYNISYKGLGGGTVRGGAPNARLAMYKVCWNLFNGYCSSADILKAVDVAIHEGVHVLSLSLGDSVPISTIVDDAIAIGSYHAVTRDIIVVCSAGNDGPFAQTVTNTAPWVITVAASTMDRAFPTSITLGNNITLQGQSLFTGPHTGFTRLIYPKSTKIDSTSTSICDSLSSLNKTMVSGNVVLCFTSYSEEALREAGCVGVIIATNPSDLMLPSDDDFPNIQVDYEVGTRILSYIRSTSAPLVKLSRTKTVVGKLISAKVAAFSSRGPNSATPAILKPDVAAPGVNILAAYSPLRSYADGGYAVKSGTSLSTPHVSGIVALLKVMHPSWSPAAIRSALVTTASRNGPSCSILPIFAEGSPRKLANPFDYGGGIVNPNKAAYPGLVYDMGREDYINFLCAVGYNTSALSQIVGQVTACSSTKPSVLDVNLPSITIPNLRDNINLTRSVTNVGPVDSVYKVDIDPPLGVNVAVRPDTLVFNSSVKTITFTVAVSTTHHVNTGYYFGSLTWTDGKHVVTSALSVRTQIADYTDGY